jgi:hypothetical protein
MNIRILEDITASAEKSGATTKRYKKNTIYDVYDRLALILIKDKKAVEVINESDLEITRESDLKKVNKKDKRKKEKKMFNLDNLENK